MQTTSDFTLQQGQGCHLGFLAGVVVQQVNGLGRAALCAAEARCLQSAVSSVHEFAACSDKLGSGGAEEAVGGERLPVDNLGGVLAQSRSI